MVSFGDGWTDRLTNDQILVIVESISCLKSYSYGPDEANIWYAMCMEEPKAEKTARMPTTIAL